LHFTFPDALKINTREYIIIALGMRTSFKIRPIEIAKEPNENQGETTIAAERNDIHCWYTLPLQYLGRCFESIMA
jgi:hypothetical protein